MPGLIFATPNWSAGAALTALTAAAGRPVTNLQLSQPGLYYQSVGTGPHKIEGQLSAARAANFVSLIRHNGTEAASYRLRFGASSLAVGLGVSLYDSTEGFGSELFFDGQDSRVEVVGGPALDAATFTIEAWIRPQVLRRQGILERTGGSLSAQLWMENDGRIRFRGKETGIGNLLSASAVPVREWTHLAAVYDASSQVMSLYVNGVLSASAPSIVGTFDGEGLEIASVEAGFRFYGSIDDVRFWNVARTGAQILGAYAAPLSTVPASCVGYWKFDSASGATALDSSASSYDGTLEDGPRWDYPHKLRVPWGAAGSDGLPVDPDLDPFEFHDMMWWMPAGVHAPYCRLDILDPDNPDGHLRASQLVVSNAWESEHNVQYGADMVGVTDPSPVDILPNGATSILVMPTREDKSFTVRGRSAREVYENAYQLARVLGISTPFMLVFNALEPEFLQQQITYCRFKSPPRVLYAGWGVYDHQFAIEEMR